MRIMCLSLVTVAMLLGAHSQSAHAVQRAPDFATLPIYAQSRPAIQGIAEAQAKLAADTELSAAELERFLIYDALNHYLAVLLGIIDPLDQRYSARFEALGQQWGADFSERQLRAQQQAAALARALRFDVALFKNAARQVHNSSALEAKADGGRRIMQRLESISATLRRSYPVSEGELPPVLIAFALSFYDPRAGNVPVNCRNPLPAAVAASVFEAVNSAPLAQ